MKARGLHIRFLLVMLASAALFSTVAGSLSYWIGYRQQVAEGRQTIEDLVTAVEKTAAIGAFAADTVLMREVIDGLATHRLVASVRIDDATGHALVRSGRDATAASPTDDAGAVVVPLYSPFNRQELTARLVIHPALGEIAAQGQRRTWAVIGLLVLQVAMAAGLLYLTAERFVSRPIVRLARKLRSIQPGSDERLAVPHQHSDDEIGVLIAGANALLHANAVTLERERHLRLDVERMEAQYRQIFDSTSAGIFLLDADGRLINGNPTVLKVMGLPLGDVQQLRGEDFLVAAFDDPEHVRELIQRAAQRRETLTDDLRLRERDGSPRWVHCLISVQHSEAEAAAPGTAPPMLVEGVMYDITDRKLAERRVRHQAEHDVLTGLKNRLATNDAIDRILAESKAGREAATLLFIDLDGFKHVNDSLGHSAGDEVLRHCAERMHRVARRASDVLGRIGGDEFVVVLPRTGPEDAHGMQVAEALVRSLSTPIALSDGREAQVGVSIGMACYPLHGKTRHLLEEAADQALYAVKRTGKHSYAMALPSHETWADTRPTTEELV